MGNPVHAHELSALADEPRGELLDAQLPTGLSVDLLTEALVFGFIRVALVGKDLDELRAVSVALIN